jgi:hypothetical protein
MLGASSTKNEWLRHVNLAVVKNFFDTLSQKTIVDLSPYPGNKTCQNGMQTPVLHDPGIYGSQRHVNSQTERNKAQQSIWQLVTQN